MKIKEIMNPTVYKLSETCTLAEAFNMMQNKGIKRIFVEDFNNKIVGVLSYGDIAEAIVKNSNELLDIMANNIKNISLKEVLTINENHDIKEGAKIMVHAGVSALLVIDDNNNFVGTISQTDILRYTIKENIL
ncbi:CBS domain-containing protein [Methanococcus aeolicus]|jgi:predicted transcriptional regulator|uniref:Signal transduction protein with CBS domains n=1 Tax=Methanococcus aeolicus (strain ATCC BAA-1280 / DSM 17508 / OCM 812 / Nankai-3) TaxID=419665 RepID=A6UUZ0_META3|nr:CBS domain-containing protein [Methanococcus aeolicus]ABR56312.1 putative signal transduction protein with CBS domains [Methanococcus aeolicus Nankai-3]UXM84320.1 CBS domain-containing protein [Methanococcus aeolicus]